MFMKQLKFLMVAFTLLMGVSFTSCLNDDAGESMYDGIGYVRTVMGSYFVDLYGNTYHPTQWLPLQKWKLRALKCRVLI